MEMHHVLQILKQWRMRILLACLIGAAAGLTVNLLQPKVYQAEATLFVSSPNHSDINTLLGNQEAAKALASFPQSDAVLRATLQVVGDKSLTLPKLATMVSVQNDRGTQFVVVHVRDNLPERAAFLATEIAKQSIAQFQMMLSDPNRTLLGQDLQQQVTQLATEIKSAENEIQQQDQQLMAIEGQPVADATEQKARVDQQTARLDRLNLTLSGLRSAYSQLYSEQISYFDSSNNTQVTLLQDAQIPDNSVGLGRTLAIAMGLLAGLVAIVGVIVLVEQNDDTLRTPAKVVEASALPLLLMVERFQTATRSLVLLDSSSHHVHVEAPAAPGEHATPVESEMQTASVGEEETMKLAPLLVKQPVLVQNHLSNGTPKARYLLHEEFLTLGVFLHPEQAQVGPLLVTSPEHGDGKSLVAAQIALALARLGVAVVLVDANLRNPTVHERFGLTNKVGLSTLLTDQQLTTPARDLLQKTHEPLLAVLTAGPAIAAPAEALASPALATIMEQISAHAYVVIDSPAVLNASEVAIIASRSERALMVVAAQQTSAAKLKRAMETLTLAEVSVPGIILNRVEKEYLR